MVLFPSPHYSQRSCFIKHLLFHPASFPSVQDSGQVLPKSKEIPQLQTSGSLLFSFLPFSVSFLVRTAHVHSLLPHFLFPPKFPVSGLLPTLQLKLFAEATSNFLVSKYCLYLIGLICFFDTVDFSFLEIHRMNGLLDLFLYPIFLLLLSLFLSLIP